ncbi:hypothetical protein ADUPG1_012197 [Aduncisulcus paluster]|uniref:Uncharacterized protein n=1 Tax=Aduncisulcus paluster TaxID=2918883 RepID=A0ABQ5JYM3_9EUKA|nr:hypothetical protein ADUPG1_012197 [Aduncisulcus paluster]
MYQSKFSLSAETQNYLYDIDEDIPGPGSYETTKADIKPRVPKVSFPKSQRFKIIDPSPGVGDYNIASTTSPKKSPRRTGFGCSTKRFVPPPNFGEIDPVKYSPVHDGSDTVSRLSPSVSKSSLSLSRKDSPTTIRSPLNSMKDSPRTTMHRTAKPSKLSHLSPHLQHTYRRGFGCSQDRFKPVKTAIQHVYVPKDPYTSTPKKSSSMFKSVVPRFTKKEKKLDPFEQARIRKKISSSSSKSFASPSSSTLSLLQKRRELDKSKVRIGPVLASSSSEAYKDGPSDVTPRPGKMPHNDVSALPPQTLENPPMDGAQSEIKEHEIVPNPGQDDDSTTSTFTPPDMKVQKDGMIRDLILQRRKLLENKESL